jgi:DNA-binding NarL/FixJ family response regulator
LPIIIDLILHYLHFVRTVKQFVGNYMRLFIADADRQLRVGLQILLHQQPGMQVIGMAVNANGLLDQVKACEPDVLLLDWRLPGIPVTELIAHLRTLNSPPKVIVLSIRSEKKSAAKAAGADAFFSKNRPPDELLEHLRTIRDTRHIE